MKKKLFISLLVMMLATVSMAASLRQIQLQIVDEFENPVTTITSISIFDAGTSSATTISSDRSGVVSMVNPVTTSSTNSTFDQSRGFVRWFQRSPDFKVTITDGSKTLTIDNMDSSNTRFPWYDNYIGTAASLSVGDNESITVGTDSDMVLAWNDGSDFMSWIPAVDGSAFNLGTSGTGANTDFNWFVGTALGMKGDEGAATLVIDGLTTSINASSNFNTSINTGTSTGAVAIGSSTSGTVVVNTTTTATYESDGQTTIKTTDASADVLVDAEAGSVIVRGTEEAADAIVIDADGTAGGIDVNAGTGSIDIDVTGGDFTVDNDGAGKDITLTSDAGRVVVKAEEAADNAITLVSAAGGIDVDAALSIVVTSSEETGDAIVINASGTAGGIDITSGTGDVVVTSTDDIVLTNATAAGDMIQLLNTAGTSVTEDSAAIQMTATAGGIQIQSDAAIDGDVIILRADGGVTNDILIHNDQGTGADSIDIISDAGGITITAALPFKLEAALTLNDTQAIAESDDTPDVGGFSLFETHTTADTIDDFDGTLIEEGQIIIVFSKGAITYDVDGGALICGTTDLVTAAGDVTFWVYDGTNWQLISWMDDAVDQNGRG